MTDNSRKVLDYLKEHYGEDLTANAIAEALDIKVAAVTGSVNGLVRNGRAVRTAATVEKDGKSVEIKYISLTEDGLNFDPDAAADAE